MIKIKICSTAFDPDSKTLTVEDNGSLGYSPSSDRRLVFRLYGCDNGHVIFVDRDSAVHLAREILRWNESNSKPKDPVKYFEGSL